MAKVPVTILIPIKNEAANLPRCLAAIAWADEIIAVDSQSSDGSIGIVEAAGHKVVQFHFKGTWPKKKNWALENIPLRNEWVFILDADEVMPIESEKEFRELIESKNQEQNGYWINRRFMFMGAWLKHSYYPNWNLRLFRHKLGRYERLIQGQTGSGDNEVHEHIVVQGSTGKLRYEMDHYAFPSIDVFVEKHNRYSNWEARLQIEQGLAASAGHLQSSHVGWRRRIKTFASKFPFRPTMRFLYVYLFQLGFLDGKRGYYFAKLHAFYEFLSVAKAAELRMTMHNRKVQ